MSELKIEKNEDSAQDEDNEVNDDDPANKSKKKQKKNHCEPHRNMKV